MLVKARFTRMSFVGKPAGADPRSGSVQLPKELITAQEVYVVVDCPDEDFYSEDCTNLDNLLWDALQNGCDANPAEYAIATPAPYGWTRHWSSWTMDGHIQPA